MKKFNLNLLFILSIGLTITSFQANANKTWNYTGDSFAMIESQKSPIEYAQMSHYSNDCSTYVSFGFLSGSTPEILTVNGTDVIVKLSGHNGLGVPFYVPESQRARKYVKNEFTKKNSVSVKHDGKTMMFSASGFSKTSNSVIESCKKMEARKSAAL